MKTKTILVGLIAIMALGIFSFKNHSGEEDASVVIIGQIFGDDAGFIITYGDDRKEIRPFKKKTRNYNAEFYVLVQIQANEILTEFKKKGYHIVCSHDFSHHTLILEKN